MASYRPFPPPQAAFAPPPPPNPSQLLPPPPPRGPVPPDANPYIPQPPPQAQNPHHNYGRLHPYGATFKAAQQPQQFSYQQPPPPAPAYNLPPPPPPPMQLPPQQPPGPPAYYPSSSASQYSAALFNQQAPLPPPLPPRPASPPPLPPPSQTPVHSQPPQPVQRPTHEKDRHGNSHQKHTLPPRPHRGSSIAPPARGASHGHHLNGPSGKVETEEERRIRKKKEYEKQRQDEKRQQMMKESQVAMLQKTQMLTAAAKQHGSMVGSRLDRRAGTFLSADRTENRLKKPTTFLCKLKFRNELPDPTAQPKLLAMNINKDRYTKYTISSLEKMYKPKLYLEPDLGIPLDLLDISVYCPPARSARLAPEDEELLRDTDIATPVKHDGIRRKERPTDKGVAWLVKTQYISSLSTENHRTSISEKQAKEQRDAREGRNTFLETLNNRDKQIQAIEESFKAAKLRPVHQTNPKLEPVGIFPLLPDMERYNDQFVIASFDGDPTAESEIYNKLDISLRTDAESEAIMKSFVANGSDPSKPEKFIAYMVPSPHELFKDIYDESEDVSYSWIREYHWEVRGDDDEDPTTYLVNFDEDCAKYLPLPRKLTLQKRRAKEGRSVDEVEHYPVPSRVTVRRRPQAAVLEIEPSRGNGVNNEYGSSKMNLKRAKSLVEDDDEPHHKVSRMEDMDQYSGEEYMSD